MIEQPTLTYNIGDKFWIIDTKLNWDAKKIKMIDAEGREWYRYADERKSYKIIELEIVGKMFHTIEGDDTHWLKEDHLDRYAVRYDNGHLGELWQEDLDNELVEHYFRTREDAEAKLAELKAED